MAKLFFALAIASILEKTRPTGEVTVKCTMQFCDEYVQRFPCPPLDPACSNPNVSLVLPSGTVCNCCEQCFLFQELGEDCVVGRPGQLPPKVMCRPGTECRKGKCKRKEGPDPDFYGGYECREGKCRCAVIENNAPKEIFGAFREKDIKGQKQCECAIFAHNARNTINKFLRVSDAWLATPRCLPNGQFDPLQCLEGMCGCVDRETGLWDSGVRRVPVPAIGPGHPKCFDEKRHKTGQYYTDCERERNSLMSDMSLEELGEVSVLLSHRVHCTPEGEYEKSCV